MAETLPPLKLYDIVTDTHREVTQSDVDRLTSVQAAFGFQRLANLRVQEIAVAVGQGKLSVDAAWRSLSPEGAAEARRVA